jgi:TonB family protein
MMKFKINFMETKSNPSDDEIRSYMNFDNLVENARKLSGRRRLRHVWIAVSVALTLVPAWLIINNQQQKEMRAQLTGIDTDSTANDGLTNSLARPNLTSPDKVSPVDSVEGTDSVVEKKKKSVKGDIEKTRDDAPSAYSAIPERSTQTGTRQPTTEAATLPQVGSTLAVNDTYVQAEPLDGYTQLYAYFSEHLTYPFQSVKDSVEGIEMVSFIIDEGGKPTNILITHSLGAPFDEEARRVIKEMPAWRPATLNGDPVASQLSVPLTFQLNRIKKP